MDQFGKILLDPLETGNAAGFQKNEAKNQFKYKKRLIAEVRKHEELYNPAHKNFANIIVREELWNQIAHVLNSDAGFCKNIWVDLRQQYQRYVRQLRKFFLNKKQGKRRPMMAMETEMLFLWRFVADKRQHCPLPYISKIAAVDVETRIEPNDDDDIIMIENPPIVIDLEDDDPKPVNAMTTSEMRRLVQIIQIYQELYNPKNRYYDDYKRKGIIWNAIANELNDKATKLMKLWFHMQTRFEWELQNMPRSELTDIPHADDGQPENNLANRNASLLELLDFLKPIIYRDNKSVYKQSYYLKQGWQEPIDNFKGIFNLLGTIKKIPDVLNITESLIDSTEKSEGYRIHWQLVAKLRNSTAGQCETTWLIMRAFYWELMNMRKQSYQLQDKWYFEAIITDLYVQAERSKIKKVSPFVSAPTAKYYKLRTKTTAPMLAPNTVAPAIPAMNTVAPAMPAMNTVASSVSATNTVVSSMPATSTVASSMPAINTVASSVPAMITVGSSMPAMITVASSTPATNTVASSMPPTNTVGPTRLQVAGPITTTAIAMTPTTGTMVSIPTTVLSAPLALTPGTTAMAPAPTVPISVTTPLPTLPVISAVMSQGSVMPTVVKTVKTIQVPILSSLLNAKSTASSEKLPTASSRPYLLNGKKPGSFQNAFVETSSRCSLVNKLSCHSRPVTISKMNTKLPTLPVCSITTTPTALQLTYGTPLPPTSNTNNINNTSQHHSAASATPTTSTYTILSSTQSVVCPPRVSNVPVTTIPPAVTAKSQSVTTQSPLPKITNAVSLLSPNEIMIQLVASPMGNQLVVHGPPLTENYCLSMGKMASFIRTVMAIPLLHNKEFNRSAQVTSYWQYVAKKFSLPVYISKACWNFLAENFSYFPQIAPMEKLTTSFEAPGIPIWHTSKELFRTFDVDTEQKGWVRFEGRMQSLMEEVAYHRPMYQYFIAHNNTNIIDNDVDARLAWIALRKQFRALPNLIDMYVTFHNVFWLYMSALEQSIDNKWSMNWWRVLARMQFLLTERYKTTQPFYYIVRNKVIEEIERCNAAATNSATEAELSALKALWMHPVGQRGRNHAVIRNPPALAPLSKSVTPPPSLSFVAGKYLPEGEPKIDAYSVIQSVKTHPNIYKQCDKWDKINAWMEVAQELHASEDACRNTFERALRLYRIYKLRDPSTRCRIAFKYFKDLDDIYHIIKRGNRLTKLNIKTPTELNRQVSGETGPIEFVYPERFLLDITMTNCSTALVMKNWAFGVGNMSTETQTMMENKLYNIFEKYRMSH